MPASPQDGDPETAPQATAGRPVVGLVVGLLLFVLAVFAAHGLPVLVLGLELRGPAYAIVALLFAPLALGAATFGLRIAGYSLLEAGFTLENALPDVAWGGGLALAYALLQFFVLIPATGGAERADLVVVRELIGPSGWGLAAFILLAWGGGFAEEVFFRSHLMTALRGILGSGWGASALVVLIPAVLFAAPHMYQGGWVGILDAGLFGGLGLSLLFLWRGRLLPCVVAHGLWNTLASVAVFVS